MLRENKRKLFLSSAVILLPVLFGLIVWNRLPGTLITHWGADGKADGSAAKALAVFGLPLAHLLVHLLCLCLTLRDPKQQRQSPRALGMVFWILPVCSLVTSGMMYRAALGKEPEVAGIVPVLLGVLFVWIGNYLPKLRRNSTLGVKVSWTLGNEENWNRTHRFAGKLWVGGGLLLLLGALLPLRAMVWVMICVTAALGIAPIAYSYAIFRQHRKAGVAYEKIPKSRAEKIASRVAAVLVCVTLLGTALLLFTGSMEATCGDTALTIHATWWADLSLSYSEIDTIEYRSNLDTGMRTNGFGSARFSLGTFCNDEFGSYTLYAYTKASEFVVLTADGKTLVIGMDEPERTREIYDELIARIHR